MEFEVQRKGQEGNLHRQQNQQLHNNRYIFSYGDKRICIGVRRREYRTDNLTLLRDCSKTKKKH